MADSGYENEAGTPEPTAGPSGPRPNHIIMLLCISASLALAGLLFATFWITRPYNLERRTTELVEILEQSLVDNFIPRENIVREGPFPQVKDDGRKTTWSAYIFEVRVPSQLNLEGLRTILQNAMGTYYVRVQEKDGEHRVPGVQKLALYLNDLEFAELNLLPAVEDRVATNRSDLREPSTRIADLTDEFLQGLGLSPSHTRENEIPKEDLNSLWNYTRFTVALPKGMTLGAFGEQLDATLPDGDVAQATGQDDGVNVTISLDGRVCVGLVCSTTPGGDPIRPKAVTLDDVLEHGLQGSEPNEGAMESMPLPPPPLVEAPEQVSEPVMLPRPAPVIEAPPTATGKTRLAIIIDDGGYVRADSDRVLALDPRLTLAILPNTPHGAATAREGAERGFEIMLHMPMETDSASEQSVEGTLYTAMGKEEIQKLTRNAIDQYPEIVGINNHTGSKFTSNEKKMKFVLDVLKERDLFFIDSFTKSSSVAFETARAAGIPTARRDVFLDNDADAESIRRQFELLVKQAIAKGSAIGIGHFQKANTAKVLAEELPKLANAGIELVHASELLQ